MSGGRIRSVGAAGALNRTIPVTGTDEIARLASLAVCARENEDWDALREKAAALKDSLGATVELVQGDSLTISSTELRQGGALRCYTPESVADYIDAARVSEHECFIHVKQEHRCTVAKQQLHAVH